MISPSRSIPLSSEGRPVQRQRTVRTPSVAIVIALALAAPFVSSCRQFPSTQTPETRGSNSPSGEAPASAHDDATLRIILECDHRSVALDQSIPIRVLLQNPSATPVRAACPKHNRYETYAVVVTREDGTAVRTGYDDPYFYRFDPHVRRGVECTPVELPDDDAEICVFPPDLEWVGIIGTTMFSCGGEGEESYAEPVYLRLREPGLYTIRVDYRFDRARARAIADHWGEPADFSEVPELDVRSNEIVVRVRDEASEE